MPSTFAEKLDFLMKLTNTPNSVLGRALSFDASYISRIRNGKRGVPKHQPFIVPAAAFFARNLRESYQQAAAAEAISYPSEWPQDLAIAAALIEGWLSAPDGISAAPADPVGSFLSKLAASATHDPEGFAVEDGPSPGSDKLYYFGNEGKRDAVRAFLRGLVATDAPHSLLLHSDEDMTWLVEDTAFLSEWAALLAQLIAQGGRVTIVHSLNRDIGEMLEALRQWVPLYMSGSIEPYYCPKVRDRIYRRTLFIARGTCALVSSSVGTATQGMATLFVRDAQAVGSFEAEYAEYLKLCRPLMRIYLAANRNALAEACAAFAAASGQTRASSGFDDIAPGKIAVFANEEAGVLVFHRGDPAVAFHITQQTMFEGFWEHLGRTSQSETEPARVNALLEECLAGM